MPERTKVAIIGAAGYSGGELTDILLRHPHAQIVGLFGSGKSDKPTSIGDLHPHLRNRINLDVRPAELSALKDSGAQAIFLATPHEASIHWANDLLASSNSPTVLDLSGAFRLPANLYPKFYGFEHGHPALLKQAVYGLPELNRAKIVKGGGANLIAVPGCYPTSAILPLAPLARAGAIAPNRRVIIDATSGVSGAGRSPVTKSLFCEVSLQPYNILKHRHNPEIDIHSGAATLFTPHVGPYARGILSTIHIDLADGWNADRFSKTLHAAYDNEPFIRLLNPDKQGWPSVAAVEHTNFCDIAWAIDEPNKHAIVISALDNLVKGAAGQAVQCFNLAFGFDETTALNAARPA